MNTPKTENNIFATKAFVGKHGFGFLSKHNKTENNEEYIEATFMSFAGIKKLTIPSNKVYSNLIIEYENKQKESYAISHEAKEDLLKQLMEK